jgi:Transposase
MTSSSTTTILGEVPGGHEPAPPRSLYEEVSKYGCDQYACANHGVVEGPPALDTEPMAEAWMKRFSHTNVRVELLDFAPPTEPCPKCGRPAKRHQVKERGPIVDASLEGPILLMVKVGVYVCKTKTCCGTGQRKGRWYTFRKPLPFTVPRGRYTLRARELGINGVKLDGMPFSKVVQRLAREFHMAPARSTAWEWHKAQGDQVAVLIDYQKWSVESLSGVVCIDEMYDGEFCMLIATDPLSNLTLGFQVLTGSVDGEQMAKFMQYLDNKGVRPDVIVTDESQLYPKALSEVWPKAKHQLCIFHILKLIVKEVLAAVREFVKTLPEDPKHGRGRPSKDEPPRSKENSERRKQLYDSRYQFVRNPEKMGPEATAALDKLLDEHPALRTVRLFMLDVFTLFGRNTTLEQAQDKRCEMLANPAYKSNDHLKKALKKFEDDNQFAKMMTYVDYANLNRTNNDVERENRWLRKKQKNHYKLRRAKTIGNAIALRMKQEQEGTANTGPKLQLRASDGQEQAAA